MSTSSTTVENLLRRWLLSIIVIKYTTRMRYGGRQQFSPDPSKVTLWTKRNFVLVLTPSARALPPYHKMASHLPLQAQKKSSTAHPIQSLKTNSTSSSTMQLIAVTTALFASATLAMPQWQPSPQSWNPNPWAPPGTFIPPGRGGNEEGRYHGGCSCSVGGQLNSQIGQYACNTLSASYPNLYWNGQACVDANGQGVEQNGFTRSCQDFARQLLPNAFGFDFANTVYADCTIF